MKPFLKRTIDLLVALGGLLCLAPFLLILLLMVRFTSQGPGLFRQKRIGKGGRPFTLYKFRTMHCSTVHVPTHQIDRGQITPLGLVLRRYKLDEFPQLINVLRGQMSLVGPRPSLPTQLDLIEARRLSGALDVLPGMTGLSQINGIDMSEVQRLALMDGEYARNQKITTDLIILAQTFIHPLLGRPRDIVQKDYINGSQKP